MKRGCDREVGHDPDRPESLDHGGAKESPAAARNWNAPFPVSPSGGKAGAGGFPPRRSTLRASQERWPAPCGRLPPQEGCCPLVDPPLGAHVVSAPRHANRSILFQAINFTLLNCHPCHRAKVLPMSPAAQPGAPPAPEARNGVHVLTPGTTDERERPHLPCRGFSRSLTAF